MRRCWSVAGSRVPITAIIGSRGTRRLLLALVPFHKVLLDVKGDGDYPERGHDRDDDAEPSRGDERHGHIHRSDIGGEAEQGEDPIPISPKPTRRASRRPSTTGPKTAQDQSSRAGSGSLGSRADPTLRASSRSPCAQGDSPAASSVAAWTSRYAANIRGSAAAHIRTVSCQDGAGSACGRPVNAPSMRATRSVRACRSRRTSATSPRT